jgi:hypothetical protein
MPPRKQFQARTVTAILDMVKSGVSYDKAGRKFHVSQNTIRRVCLRHGVKSRYKPRGVTRGKLFEARIRVFWKDSKETMDAMRNSIIIETDSPDGEFREPMTSRKALRDEMKALAEMILMDIKQAGYKWRE